MDSKKVIRTPLTATGAATIHPKRENISFGRWAMPVMAEKMQDSEPLDRKRALQSLCDYVYDSKRVASKEFENVVQRLKYLHKDSDDEVRLKVIECFAAITATAAGRRVFLKHEFLKEALELLNDEQEDIRFTANVVLQRFSILPIGADALVDAGAIESLIKRIPNETDNVLTVLLGALHRCCLVDPDKALQADGLAVLAPLLDRPCPNVKAKTSTVIKDLTTEDSGRRQAFQLCQPLIKIASEEDEEVKAKALSALMMIVNSTDGKNSALDNAVIEKVFPLLKSNNIEVRINTIKVLTAIGETSKGRILLLQKLSEISALLKDNIMVIRKATEKLIAVVKFKP